MNTKMNWKLFKTKRETIVILHVSCMYFVFINSTRIQLFHGIKLPNHLQWLKHPNQQLKSLSLQLPILQFYCSWLHPSHLPLMLLRQNHQLCHQQGQKPTKNKILKHGLVWTLKISSTVKKITFC